MRIPGLRKLLATVHQSSLIALLIQSSLSQRYMRHISRITNISHRSGWSTRQPVELLHQPDNSWPLLQSQSSCAAETEGHSRRLLQVLLLTPLSCTTKNSWRCNEEKLLQERYNANLWVAEPLQYKLYSNQQLCRFQREECKVRRNSSKSIHTM